MSKRILKIIICLYLFLAGLPFFSFSHAQQETSKVSVKPVLIQLENQNFSQGELKTELTINNPNLVNYRSAYYTIKLQGSDVARTTTFNGQQVTEFTQGPLITFYTSEKFDFGAGETKSESLNLTYSSAISEGQYKLQVAVFSDGDVMIGGLTKDISLSGSGNFLTISKCILVVNKIEYDPIIGPNVAPKEAPIGRCMVTNSSNTDLTVFSEAEYAINSVAEKKDNQIYSDKTPITIAAKSSKTINFSLPALDTPQVYESLSYLRDSKGTIVSPRVAFRWIVGGESSLIRSISLDKSEYKNGEKAKVTVGADPSMDLYWRGGGPAQHIGDPTASSAGFLRSENQGTPLTDARIWVSIKDGAGFECGTSEQKVSIDPNQNIWSDQVLSVSITKNCSNPSVTAKVFNNDKELASKEIKVPVIVASDQQSVRQSLWWIVGGILLGLAVVAGIFYVRSKNTQIPKNPPSLPPTHTPISGKSLTVLIIWLGLFGLVHSGANQAGFDLISPIKSAQAATEIGPGSPVSVHYEGIKAYRPGEPCPGPVWKADNPQPQIDDAQGGCILDMVSGHDETNFTFLDTQDQIVYENGGFKVPVSGQFTGYGCGNSKVGLIVRAYINGSSEGVKINGGGSRVVFDNLGSNGGGGGTNFTQNLVITPGETNVCGPHNIKVELIPYIKHAGIVASDKAEDQLYTSADVPGWNNITYTNRRNCGGGDSCFGILQQSNIPTASCLACNQSCESTDQCLGNVDGCTECRANDSGQKVCQPPPLACNASCTDSKDCSGNKEGCTSCEPNSQGSGKVCAPPPACGTGCVRDDQCAGAVKDGCTVCLPNTTGSGSICSKPPACGVGCEADYQCAGAKDGCSVCAPGADGKKICQEPFDEGACKCDGFNAINLQDPTNSNFQFEAFAKVEGANINKAGVKSIQFQMTKSTKSNPNAGTVIASSELLTPQIVSSTSDKVRYKSTWSVAPPAYDPNGVYRVFANIKCDRKFATKSAGLNSVLGDTYSSDSNQMVQKELNYSPLKLAQSNQNLELGTLEDGYFTRITETDSCRFIRFEYGQY